MGKLADSVVAIGNLDLLSYSDSFIHRLDARSKLLVTLAYLITVVSWNRYAIWPLIPLASYPLVLGLSGHVPAREVFKRLLFAAPFVVLVGIFNPVFDTAPFAEVMGVSISAGWISFLSILIRFVLTVSATLVLIAVTGMDPLCSAAEKLGAPRIFVMQLAFLYRYLFVLILTALRMIRAAEMRSFNRSRLSVSHFGSLVGHLLLRTVDRAQRIHVAMCARGFNGCFPQRRPMRFTVRDFGFAVVWLLFFATIRFSDLVTTIGQLVLRGLG
ncbi:MAG: cobalt ECF transporter T component CbiQ [Deltaproteobacteria bacterium]|nr:cobalt ECF transporter T component CbiQ [Deltaproteobacteria bacterium]